MEYMNLQPIKVILSGGQILKSLPKLRRQSWVNVIWCDIETNSDSDEVSHVKLTKTNDT